MSILFDEILKVPINRILKPRPHLGEKQQGRWPEKKESSTNSKLKDDTFPPTHLSLKENKLGDSSSGVTSSQFLKSGQGFVIPTDSEQPGRSVGQAEKTDGEDGRHCNAGGSSLTRVHGEAKDVEDEGAKCYNGQGEEGELGEVVVLA